MEGWREEEEEEEEEMEGEEGRARRMMQLQLSGRVRAGRDAVYTLTYSLIMLNTDLHKCAHGQTNTARATSLVLC